MKTKTDTVCNWDKDLKWSELAIPYCIELLNRKSKHKFTRTELERDKKGSDINNNFTHIDIKANRPIYSDANIIIEWNNGWLLKEGSLTDYIMWISNNSIIVLDFKKLKEIAIQKQNNFKRAFGSYWKTTEKDGYRFSVEMSTIPMYYVQEAIIKKYEFNWDMIKEN